MKRFFGEMWSTPPLKDIDWHRLGAHLFASFLLATATLFNQEFNPRKVYAAWFGASLIYVAAFIQKAEKIDDGS